MCADPRVNSDDPVVSTEHVEEQSGRPRWWLKNPALGVFASLALGVAAFLLTSAIGKPGKDPGTAFTNLIILPIALLLPAIALGGALVAWHAFGSTQGRLRLMLAIPMAIALILNSAAIAIFARWAVRVLSP